ncbi:MAG: hypothetical protein ABW182_03300 [Sphingomonas sp.]
MEFALNGQIPNACIRSETLALRQVFHRDQTLCDRAVHSALGPHQSMRSGIGSCSSSRGCVRLIGSIMRTAMRGHARVRSAMIGLGVHFCGNGGFPESEFPIENRRQIGQSS